MSLPPQLRASLTPVELEFIACSHETIEIVPLFSMDRVRLISGVYGPFVPPTKTRVPLWLAVNLKQKMKCRIIPPNWLSVDYLKEKVDSEVLNPDQFTDVPFRYTEVAKVLLDIASDSVQHPGRVRSLLKDLREVRQAKLRNNLGSIDFTVIVDLPNLSSMEINEIRPHFMKTMSITNALTPPRLSKPQADMDIDDPYY